MKFLFEVTPMTTAQEMFFYVVGSSLAVMSVCIAAAFGKIVWDMIFYSED